MRIYELLPDPNRYLCVQSPDLRYFWHKFDGRSMATVWERPTYEVLNRSKKVADVTSWQIGTTFLVSEKARGVLAEACSPNDLEFLPFDRIKGAELFAVNVLRMEDYLDRTRTEFMSGADIPLRVAWKRDLPRALPPLFKVVGGSGTYASAELGQAVVETGLTGVRLADPGKNRIEQIRRGEPINEFPGL
jgi:hypothetical protein